MRRNDEYVGQYRGGAIIPLISRPGIIDLLASAVQLLFTTPRTH